MSTIKFERRRTYRKIHDEVPIAVDLQHVVVELRSIYNLLIDIHGLLDSQLEETKKDESRRSA